MSSDPRSTLRGLSVPLVLAVLTLAPPSAVAANNPTARATCTGPGSLGCVPCPLSAGRCPDPEGQVAPGAPVSFDGRASSDVPPGTIVSWHWNFGDGSTTTTSQAQTQHGFGNPGTYTVTLQVRDDQNQTGATTMSVVVGPRLLTTQSPGIVLGSGTLSAGATVNGRDNPSPSATIDFRLYGPDDPLCASAPVFQDLGVAYPVAGGSVASAAFTPALAGSYRWSVSYVGDPNNAPTPQACGPSVVVSPIPPPPLPVAATPDAVVAPGVGPDPQCFGKDATIVATVGQRIITGTPGRDVIVGGDAGETIDGRGGNDTICARGGDDTVRGSAGNDRVYGGRGRDLLLGGTGADMLYGQSGKDRLGGGAGADRADGGSGNDLLDERRLGGLGKDRLLGGSGADVVRTADRTADSVDCGTGRDSARLDDNDRQRLCDSVRRER